MATRRIASVYGYTRPWRHATAVTRSKEWTSPRRSPRCCSVPSCCSTPTHSRSRAAIRSRSCVDEADLAELIRDVNMKKGHMKRLRAALGKPESVASNTPSASAEIAAAWTLAEREPSLVPNPSDFYRPLLAPYHVPTLRYTVSRYAAVGCLTAQRRSSVVTATYLDLAARGARAR